MHKVVNIGVVAACTLTLAHSTRTNAQTTNTEKHPQSETLEQELEEVTITASRAATPLNQAARLITIISKEEISKAPVQSIQDLLVYVASVDVSQRGPHGVQADISIRGGSADQTAVLINGVNFSNPQTGHYSFDLPVNISDIERIEIIHGPSALIYGSGAFSGGINIITKKKTDAQLFTKLEAGMHALRKTELRSTADIGKTNNSLSFSYKASDGYIDNSDYEIYNALFQSRLNIKEESHLDFQMGYNNKSYGASTFYTALYPEQYERTSAITASVNGIFGNQLKIIPQLYWKRHYDVFELIKNTDTGKNYHRGDTYGANMMFRYSSPLGVTHFGADLRKEEIMSSRLGKPMQEAHGNYTKYDGRIQTGLIFEHTLNWKGFMFSGGLSANFNTLQNDKFRFYPSVSIAYRPVNTFKIYTTWSRSSRLPTFTDLYYTTETHISDQTLQAERSETFDLGFNYRYNGFNISLTGFLMNGRNIIDWVRKPGEEKWSSWNLTEIDKIGMDFNVAIPLNSLIPMSDETSILSVSYTRMHQDFDSKGFESGYALNHLRDKLTANFNHKIYKGWSASMHFRLQKRMGSFRKYEGTTDMGIQSYPTFSTCDLKLYYAHKKITFNVDINNLFDTKYYDIGNVPQPGFWLTAGVSYKM